MYSESKRKRPSRTERMLALPADFVPGPADVICAKGKHVKQHIANRFLRSLVKTHLEEYSQCPSKVERSYIVSRILKAIRKEGTFVRQVGDQWFDVGDRNAREKIGQAFRDTLHTQFKSSARAKRRQQQAYSCASLSSGSESHPSRPTTTTTPPPPTKRKAAPSPASTPTCTFPISEVSFDSKAAPVPVPPELGSRASGISELEWTDFKPIPLSEDDPEDLEPLPLFHGVDLNDLSWSTASSDGPATAVDVAMQDMFSSQCSCSVISSTTAPSEYRSSIAQQLQQQRQQPLMQQRTQAALTSPVFAAAPPHDRQQENQLLWSSFEARPAFTEEQQQQQIPQQVHNQPLLLPSLSAFPSLFFLNRYHEPTRNTAPLEQQDQSDLMMERLEPAPSLFLSEVEPNAFAPSLFLSEVEPNAFANSNSNSNTSNNNNATQQQQQRQINNEDEGESKWNFPRF